MKSTTSYLSYSLTGYARISFGLFSELFKIAIAAHLLSHSIFFCELLGYSSHHSLTYDFILSYFISIHNFSFVDK